MSFQPGFKLLSLIAETHFHWTSNVKCHWKLNQSVCSTIIKLFQWFFNFFSRSSIIVNLNNIFKSTTELFISTFNPHDRFDSENFKKELKSVWNRIKYKKCTFLFYLITLLSNFIIANGFLAGFHVFSIFTFCRKKK